MGWLGAPMRIAGKPFEMFELLLAHTRPRGEAESGHFYLIWLGVVVWSLQTIVVTLLAIAFMAVIVLVIWLLNGQGGAG